MYSSRKSTGNDIDIRKFRKAHRLVDYKMYCWAAVCMSEKISKKKKRGEGAVAYESGF